MGSKVKVTQRQTWKSLLCLLCLMLLSNVFWFVLCVFCMFDFCFPCVSFVFLCHFSPAVKLQYFQWTILSLVNSVDPEPLKVFAPNLTQDLLHLGAESLRFQGHVVKGQGHAAKFRLVSIYDRSCDSCMYVCMSVTFHQRCIFWQRRTA